MFGNDEGPEDNEGSWDGRGLTLGCKEVEGPLVGIDEGLPLGIDEVEGLSVGMDEELSLGDNAGSSERLFGELPVGNP